jgi:Protein of unknown function (DUF2892)./Rhodanese-like domain.
MSTSRISAAEFENLRGSTSSSPISVIDLRTSAEIEQERIADCICLPFQQANTETVAHAFTNRADKTDNRLFLLCQSGMRADATVRQLGPQPGIEWVIIEGGVNAIKAAGGNVLKGKGRSIPLERQVRIAAGIAILAGVLLGATLNPNFLLLSGFVGAGLVFAGVTNRCGLAFLLARMPWNH